MARISYAIPHLRAWRLHRLLTQDQLAQAAGVGRDTVYRLERDGERANELTIHKIAAGLGIAVEELHIEPPKEGTGRRNSSPPEPYPL